MAACSAVDTEPVHQAAMTTQLNRLIRRASKSLSVNALLRHSMSGRHAKSNRQYLVIGVASSDHEGRRFQDDIGQGSKLLPVCMH